MLSPTHSQPHLSRLSANFTWTLNTIYSTEGLPYLGFQRYACSLHCLTSRNCIDYAVYAGLPRETIPTTCDISVGKMKIQIYFYASSNKIGTKKDVSSKLPVCRRLTIWVEYILPLLPIYCNGPLARSVKLRVAHAPGMPETFPPPTRVSDPDMHHGTCVTHVLWCLPGSLISRLRLCRWRENVLGIPDACATRNVTYLARGPCSHGLLYRSTYISPRYHEACRLVGIVDYSFIK